MRKLLALATVLSGLIPAAVSFQVVNAAVVDTGTDGVTVNLDVATPTTVDGVTGSGDLTLTPTTWTVNDTTTYGTAQLATGATFTDFAGGVKLGGAILDVNGNSFTTKYIQSLTQDVSGTATQDTSSRVINTAATQSILTMTEASNLYATLGNADGTNSDIKLVWDTSGHRYVKTKQYNTGGMSVTGGVLELQVNDNGENYLGSGKIALNNVDFFVNTNTFRLDNEITLTGDVDFRMCSQNTLYLSGNINGDGNLRVIYDSVSLVLEGAAKTYTGKTVIGVTENAWNDPGSYATLSVTADNLLPTGTTVELIQANGGATLNMNGTTQTVAGLTGVGRVYGNGSGVLNVSTNNVTGTFTVDGASLNLNQGEYQSLNLKGTGTVNLAGGTIRSYDMDVAKVNVNGDTEITTTPAQWGKTILSGNNNMTGGIFVTEFSNNTDMLNTSDGSLFPGYTTISYSGYIMLDSDQTLSFLKVFDDNGQVAITPLNEDGTLGETIIVLRSANGTELIGTLLAQTDNNAETWDDVAVGSVDLSAGRYLLDIRGGQGGGGVGPTGGYQLGFGIKSGENATVDTVASAYSSLAITDGKIAGIDGLYMTSPVVNMASDFNVASEKTLTLNAGDSGKIVSTGSITGEGKLVLQGTGNSEVHLQGKNTYTGGTEVNVTKLALKSQNPLGTGAVVFNSATEVTLDALEPGWYEGSIAKSGMDTTTTPEKMVQTPNATNTGTAIGGDTT